MLGGVWHCREFLKAQGQLTACWATLVVPTSQLVGKPWSRWHHVYALFYIKVDLPCMIRLWFRMVVWYETSIFVCGGPYVHSITDVCSVIDRCRLCCTRMLEDLVSTTNAKTKETENKYLSTPLFSFAKAFHTLPPPHHVCCIFGTFSCLARGDPLHTPAMLRFFLC